MKKILFLYTIILLLAGCKKLMHEEEISIGKITSYDQLVSATGGVYGMLASMLKRNYYRINLNGDDLNIGTFNYEFYLYLYDQTNCWRKDNPYNEDRFIGSWQNNYSIVASVNNILCQFNLAEIKDKKFKEIIGEIYFIRAYCYLRLTRTYGEVPIINNIDNNYTVSKSSFIDIYRFIEHDLKMAMELLPENNASARMPYITPHRGSAKAILVELYLSWAGYPIKDDSKYTLAAKEAGETIDSASFFGLGLLPDFAYLWDKDHLYNSETVFSLYCANSLTKYSYYEYNWNGFYVGDFGDLPLDWNKNAKPNFYPVEINFYNNFPTGYRKEITFYTTIFYNRSQHDSLGNIVKMDTGHIHIDKVDPCSRIAYRKFYYEPTEIKIIEETGYEVKYYFGCARVYLFRYAHTVLTYAEALARSGQVNEKAYNCVNQIRRRAHHLDLNSPSVYDLQPGLSPEAFADSVVWERAWELCGEPEGRWFDLVRLEKVEELPRLRDPMEGGPPLTFDKSVYYFKSPPGDDLLNPNLRE